VILNQNAIWEMALAVDDLTVGQIVQISAGPPIRKKNPVVQELNMKKCAALVACCNDNHPNTWAQCTRCHPTIGSRLPYPCPLQCEPTVMRHSSAPLLAAANPGRSGRHWEHAYPRGIADACQ
jgi:hypothetical protein